MDHMLIAFEGEKTRQRMTEILESAGIHVFATCISGAEVLRCCRRMGSGVILCGFKLGNMTGEELYQCLPEEVAMVMLATATQLELVECEEICRLVAPARRTELVDTIRMLLDQVETISLPKRADEDQLLVLRAKELLMDRNQMTEEQAHRFIQKRSMDTGKKMAQTAMQILDGHIIL